MPALFSCSGALKTALLVQVSRMMMQSPRTWLPSTSGWTHPDQCDKKFWNEVAESKQPKLGSMKSLVHFFKNFPWWQKHGYGLSLDIWVRYVKLDLNSLLCQKLDTMLGPNLPGLPDSLFTLTWHVELARTRYISINLSHVMYNFYQAETLIKKKEIKI